MLKFYSNENFPIQMVHHLRSLSYDVLTSYEAGQANQKIPDDQVLQYATTLDRVVLTENRLDFLQLHQTVSRHSGIILCKADRDYLGKVKILHDFLMIQNEMTLENRLIRILKQNMSGQKQAFRIQEYDR
jgi:predicted nuclease of predicted toxin-antitoxin system